MVRSSSAGVPHFPQLFPFATAENSRHRKWQQPDSGYRDFNIHRSDNSRTPWDAQAASPTKIVEDNGDPSFVRHQTCISVALNDEQQAILGGLIGHYGNSAQPDVAGISS